MSEAVWIAGIIVASLILYALSGGADFGGGVWDFFAVGPRASEQRRIIREAIAPIWEANHVWLIIVVVLLFTAFPPAFAAITTALHIPLFLMLLGIVMRGSAFVFRSMSAPKTSERRWSYVFSVASIFTPVFLGVAVGAIASGNVRLNPETGLVTAGFISTWLRPFPFSIGLFTLALFSFLAASYLIFETREPDLKNDFRKRALASGVAVGIFAWLSLYLAKEGAPLIYEGLLHSRWSVEFHLTTGGVAVGSLGALAARWFTLARVLAMLQAALIIFGWAAVQYPYLIYPDLKIADAAAPVAVLKSLVLVLGVGALFLIPSFGYLFLVFKKQQLRRF